MSENNTPNPAQVAAQQALDSLFGALQNNSSFIFEAGAGAGKTYSLAKALDYLIRHRGKSYIREHKRIACITFTNIAKVQIDEQIDKHPAVHTDTIHAFCWSIIRGYQEELRRLLPNAGNWNERLTKYHEKLVAESEEVDDNAEQAEKLPVDFPSLIGRKEIIYQLGYPSIDADQITLHHDDVLHLTISLFANPKFRNILSSKYPVLLVDEYQDTFLGIADALQTYFITPQTGPQFGFFGDHWQKIYGNGCGKIENPNLQVIPKNANFRSAVNIVNVLNAMRPELQQAVKDPQNLGTARAYHTNAWQGARRTGGHWAGDLPAIQAHDYLAGIRKQLEREGWDFAPEHTKILMLTHNVLAQEQGYKDLADVFPNNESFLKKEDPFIAYFVDYLEPICEAFEKRKFGEMFAITGAGKDGIASHNEKVQWNDRMTQLLEIRNNSTIGDVLDFLVNGAKPRLFPKLAEAYTRCLAYVDEEGVDTSSEVKKLRALRPIAYGQIIACKQFINDHTPFATKHSVKGDEFENVLVVVGRGWNQYNFDQMLGWFTTGVPEGRQDTFERSRNLFYVSCSRPKRNLAVLFTQVLSQSTLTTLTNWFGADNVIPMDANLPILN